MIKNYFKIAWRNLIKNKAHSFINIAGLAVGLACSLMILLWVQNERSVDSFYKNSDRLFRVYEVVNNSHQRSGTYDTPGPLADEIKKNIPDIEYATGMGFGEISTFQVGDKVLKISGNSAGADYFKMFSTPLLQGSAQSALNSPVSIAISRKMAEQFYGSPQNAIGKIIKYQDSKNFTITAVFENLPANSSQHFEFLTNWEAFLTNMSWAREMGNNGPPTYVMLKKNANATAVNNKINKFLDLYNNVNRATSTYYIDLALQRYSESYLNGNLDGGKPNGGRIEYVHLFSIIAIFILLIACINFMNLTTARSVKRAREIGVRKVVGALRSALIQQFIVESLLITIVAVIISIGMLIVLLPFFNQITQKQIELPFGDGAFWARLVVVTLITGLLSGSYPALFLSSFNPVKVLKGTLKLDALTVLFRKGLVVFQFTLSILLITGTIIVSRQMNYIQSKNLGYDKENLVYVTIEGELGAKYEVFKNEASGMPGIQSVSRISKPPADIYGSTGAVGWVGQDTTVNYMFTQFSVGYDFLKTMKMPLVAGRDFSKDFPTDTAGYILNETAIKQTGYKDPIGKPFRLFGKPGRIIGVVKDFHFHSLHTSIGPIVIRSNESTDGAILIRTQPGKTKEAVAGIQRLCKELNPAFPATFNFVDEEYQKLYNSEQIINKLSDVFAFLAIFISCLGLLGLAMFTAEQRIKEIGIRKVLGAGVASLFALLSSEFLLLIIIALLIASPLAWYAMDKWLQGFAYRAPVQLWEFALSGGLIVLIALATVSFQAAKAALVNPIKSLRSE